MSHKSTPKPTPKALAEFLNDPDDIPDELFQEAMRRQKEKIYALIASGGDLNKKDNDLGVTPLFSAVMGEDIPLIKLLVSKGAKVNIKAILPNVGKEFTPLAAGVACGNLEVVKTVLDLGADVKSRVANGDSVLHLAAEAGYVEMVKLFINRGLGVNALNGYEETALHSAVHYGETQVVKVLIDKGANVNARSCSVAKMKDLEVPFGTDVTPLFLAAVYGHIDIVKLLIKARANVNIKTSHHHTALHPAAQEGPLELVKILIAAKIDYNAKTVVGRSALTLAAKTGQTKIVEYLLSLKGIEINPVGQDGETPIMLAAMNGHLEVVKLLVAKGVSINYRSKGAFGCTPLMAAFLDNREDVADWLIKKGANIGPSFPGYTPLHMACLAGSSVAMIRRLINNGCDINAQAFDGSTPILLAARGEPPDDNAHKDNVDIVRYLISRGADPDLACLRDRTPLHHAAKNGWVKTVECLASAVKNINPQTSLGVTPLMMAAIEGNQEVVEVLLRKGADPNIPDVMGQLPVEMAASKGCNKTVEVLLKHGATADSADNLHKQTALYNAADTNNIQMGISLLEKGASVNACDGTKQTPLHIATGRGHKEIVALLMKYGADANIKETKKGYSPLYVAVKFKFLEIVEILLKYGADVNTTNKVGIFPILVAARTSNTEMVKLLLSHGAYYNVEVEAGTCTGPPIKLARKAKNTQLITVLELIKRCFSAVAAKDSYQVDCCVRAGVIVNARNAEGKTSLVCAVSRGMIETTNLLLEYGADVALATNEGVSPLHIAVGEGNKEIVQILLSHAKELDPVKRNKVINAQRINDSATALHIAAEKNSLPFVELLLENGAVYNAKNKAGKTPTCLSRNETIRGLSKAADKAFEMVKNASGSAEELEKILEHNKCLVNARDSSGGGTLLYWAVAKEQIKIVKFLLKNGADYCLVTNKGTSPLHIAASKGYTELVRCILERMVQDSPVKIPTFVNAITVAGSAPLHVASNKDIVCCLLEAGAKFNTLNRAGKTPSELAKNEDVKELFKTTQQLFEDTKKGVPGVIDKLSRLDSNELKAVSGTRNEGGEKLLQVAVANARTDIVKKLEERLNCLN